MATVNIQDIIRQLQTAQDRANAANEARYNKALNVLFGGQKRMQQLYGNAASMIQDLGRSALQDVERGSQRAYATGRQGLISSGLGNTTILANLMRGTEEDRARAAGRVQEQVGAQRSGLAAQQAGAEMGAAGGIADFMGRRSDVGPDMGIYSSLIRSAQASGGGAQQPIAAAPRPQQPRTTVFGGFQSPFSSTSGGGGGGASPRPQATAQFFGPRGGGGAAAPLAPGGYGAAGQPAGQTRGTAGGAWDFGKIGSTAGGIMGSMFGGAGSVVGGAAGGLIGKGLDFLTGGAKKKPTTYAEYKAATPKAKQVSAHYWENVTSRR